MKLDRNVTPNKTGKYALVRLRNSFSSEDEANLKRLDLAGHIDFGIGADDFFVIRLKDKYAAPALGAYAMAAFQDDPEWGMEILNLAKMAAEHRGQRRPD